MLAKRPPRVILVISELINKILNKNQVYSYKKRVEGEGGTVQNLIELIQNGISIDFPFSFCVLAK